MNHPPLRRLLRLLLVEDDPVSATFLREAAATLPALVDTAGSLAEALTIARRHPHDLYLIDANLPDGRGETLLHAMREAGVATPALAHTAACGDDMRERLLAVGFVGVLHKPIGVGELIDALRLHLPGADTQPRGGKLPVWDDAAALGALGGQQDHVDALRALFLQELPGQSQRISKAVQEGDATGVRAELHRLVASCGFVGAARLAQAVHAMQQAPLKQDAWARVHEAIEDLRASG